MNKNIFNKKYLNALKKKIHVLEDEELFDIDSNDLMIGHGILQRRERIFVTDLRYSVFY